MVYHLNQEQKSEILNLYHMAPGTSIRARCLHAVNIFNLKYPELPVTPQQLTNKLQYLVRTTIISPQHGENYIEHPHIEQHQASSSNCPSVSEDCTPNDQPFVRNVRQRLQDEQETTLLEYETSTRVDNSTNNEDVPLNIPLQICQRRTK